MNKKSKLITALVVLFLTGVITGITGTRIAYRNMLAKALEGTPILSERVEANLGKLTLPLEQDQKIAQILKEFREQTQDLARISAATLDDSDRYPPAHSRRTDSRAAGGIPQDRTR